MREIFVQGSISEFEHDGDDADRYYLPTRATSFGINKTEGVVVLPEAPPVVNYAKQLAIITKELDLQPPKVAFVPDSDYFLDIAVRQYLNVITDLVEKGEPCKIWPYANTENLRDWVSELANQGYRLSIAVPPKVYFENIKHPQHRGGWGRQVDKPEVKSFPEKYGIPYPISFIGTGLEETLEAYRQVTGRSRNNTAYFKPVFSAGGFTIRKVESEDNLAHCYEQLRQQGALFLFGKEMPVEIQEEITDITDFVSLQYDGAKIVTPGKSCLQLIEGNNWIGNLFNGGTATLIKPEIEDIFRRFSLGMSKEFGGDFYGWGGIDIAITNRNGQQGLQVIEHNGARVTGAHPAIALSEGLGVSQKPFLIRKTPGSPNCDLLSIWDMLKKEKIAFDLREDRGVFPLLWVNGCGFLLSVGNDEKELMEMASKALESATSCGYL